MTEGARVVLVTPIRLGPYAYAVGRLATVLSSYNPLPIGRAVVRFDGETASCVVSFDALRLVGKSDGKL